MFESRREIRSIPIELPDGMSDQCILRASGINGWMTEYELAWLATTAFKQRGAVVEVGSFLGRSTAALSDSIPERTVYAVDNWTGSTQDQSSGWWPIIMLDRPPNWLFNRFLLNAADNVFPLQLDSFAAADQFDADDIRFGMIFLDNDHDYEWVKQEIAAWAPLLADGGILCGHDYAPGWGVMKAVDEVLPKREIVPNTSIWYIKKEDIALPQKGT